MQCRVSNMAPTKIESVICRSPTIARLEKRDAAHSAEGRLDERLEIGEHLDPRAH